MCVGLSPIEEVQAVTLEVGLEECPLRKVSRRAFSVDNKLERDVGCVEAQPKV